MLAPLIGIIKRHSELRNPKSYKVKFVPWYTVMGKAAGGGWYIIAPRVDPIGPIKSQTEAEDLLIAAMEEITGNPMSDKDKEKAREIWKKE